MFTDHDRFILNENKFTIFPTEEDGYDWAKTTQPLINTLVMMIGENNFFIKICINESETLDTIPRTSYVKTIEEVILKSKQMRDVIESDWIARGRRPRG